MRILVVEDEPVIAEAIKEGLEDETFRVTVAKDGRTGLRLAEEEPFAAIILDVNLPGIDGWEICSRLREDSNQTPIIMLTARGAPDDRVHGLEIGADDYLAKPFHFPELLARVNALIRRDRANRGKTLRVGDLEVDTKARTAKRAGKLLNLTDREYKLLEALASREGHVLTREVILERIWMDDRSLNSTSNTVDAHIMQLRKKVDGDHPVKLIQTLRGVGYTLRRPDDGG